MFDIGKIMQVGEQLETAVKVVLAKLDKIIELLERIADGDKLSD